MLNLNTEQYYDEQSVQIVLIRVTFSFYIDL